MMKDFKDLPWIDRFLIKLYISAVAFDLWLNGPKTESWRKKTVDKILKRKIKQPEGEVE